MNHGVGLNTSISDTTIEVNDICDIEMNKHNPFTIYCDEEGKNYEVKIEEPIGQLDANTMLYSMKLNNQNAVGFLIKETGHLGILEEPKCDIKNSIDIKSEDFVVKIGDVKSTLVTLSGGKGSSLGVLYAFSTQSSVPFKVPAGLIVTSKAYQFLLKSNPELENDISLLESFVR